MSEVHAMRPPALSALLVPGALVAIDAEAATEILDRCRYEHQRPLNDDRVLLFAMKMERGTWPQGRQIFFGRMDGNLYLIDGQHRLNAVTLAGRAQTFRIEVQDVTSLAELDDRYCEFDQAGGQRSPTQLSRALRLHDEEDGGLRPATAALLLRAAPMLQIGLKRLPPALRPRETRDLDCKREVALAWKPWALDYQSCLDCGITTRTGRFRRGGVFAAALVTLRYQRERALPFWREAIRNSGLTVGDPRQTLHSHFLSSKRAGTEYELAEAACHAWNAWLRDKRITMIRAIGSPLRLLGTPYLGSE